ncbi:60S ribosomal protein L14-2 [Citrus sinensis]|nr:60S ribosomal protein L14-2 [Citrus sinensis]
MVHPFFGRTEDDEMWLYMCVSNDGPQDPRMKPPAEDLARLGCERVLIFVAERDYLCPAGKNYYEELKSEWKRRVELVEHLDEKHFKRYVEIGRVALVNYDKDYGKLVVIVNVLDQNRALVDAYDMVRSQMKRLSLTDIKININRVPRKKSLIEAMEKADVKNKWENSSWGRKLTVQKRRAALNDFDRFKVMFAKIKKGGLVR